jgi:hypothetical protein
MPEYREPSYGESGPDLSREDVLVEEVPDVGRKNFYYDRSGNWRFGSLPAKASVNLSCFRSFLLYVCERQLMGRTHEITEQRIGTQIFNRTTDYNPGEDNIVRSYARLLRKRLDKYFEGEGRDELMRVNIPRGGYVLVFVRGGDVEEPFSTLSCQLSSQNGIGKTELGIPFWRRRCVRGCCEGLRRTGHLC